MVRTMTIPSNAPIQIKGGNFLHGKVRIQGSKNASLPVLAATILTRGKCVLHNCPRITDMLYMQKLLEYAGCHVERTQDTLTVDSGKVTEYRLPGSYVGMMRSSVILMGAMLGRLGKVGIDDPGGCVIGERPINLHLMALEKLGAVITTEGNQCTVLSSDIVLVSILTELKSLIHKANSNYDGENTTISVILKI